MNNHYCLKSLVIFLLTLISFPVVSQEILNREYPKNQIRDLALIYQGNARRPKWNTADFLPYVSHKFADGHRDWTFDGFLFLEFDNNKDVSFTTTLDKIGTKKDWEWYLDQLYAPNVSLDALDSVIDSLKSEIGEPGFKHKIVITLLTPVLTEKPWGEIDGVELDMTKYEDAAKATKWYIDEVVSRFNAKNYKNLELVGLYWLEEDMCATYDLVKHLAPLVHAHNLEFSWIPYYSSRGSTIWKEYGFDICYMQPNYLFYRQLSDLRLKDATDLAAGSGMAMEMEMDQSSLYGAKNSSYSRFQDYIDYFQSSGVWDNSAVAYYTGNNAVKLMADSNSPENQRIMDQMFNYIVERRKKPSMNTPKMDVIYNGDVLSINTTIDFRNTISYDFKKCMANDLFTFYNVKVNSQVVNSAQHSDNIGPFMTSDGNWAGGNHTFNGTGDKSAYTASVEVYANGKLLAQPASVKADSVVILVKNILKYAPNPTDTFAIENVKYLVVGNSIQVEVEHEYLMPKPTKVDRYYGMQSMFDGETEILTPLGAYNQWTPIKEINQFSKKDYPKNHHFIEKSPICYQAAYLCPEYLGTKDMVDDEDVTFIGNSWSKSYHKQIGNKELKRGDSTKWKGIYTWFLRPTVEINSNGKHTEFGYRGFYNGLPVEYYTNGVDIDGPKEIR